MGLFSRKADTPKLKLAVPPQYKLVKEKMPDSFGGTKISKENAAYSLEKQFMNAIVICFKPLDAVDVDFDDPQRIIDAYHDAINDRAGIIEIENGSKENGNKYIYSLIKMRMENKVTRAISIEVISYTLNLTLKINGEIICVNCTFSSKTKKDPREIEGIEEFTKEHPNATSKRELAREGFYKDPYDPEFTKGFLMNQYEASEFDEKFPGHPLTEARKFIKFVLENNL